MAARTDRPFPLPFGVIGLGDFLVTRLVETVVHADDLADTLGLDGFPHDAGAVAAAADLLAGPGGGAGGGRPGPLPPGWRPGGSGRTAPARASGCRCSPDGRSAGGRFSAGGQPEDAGQGTDGPLR
ncbi:hypothetical protein AB0O31_03830 [Kitasatospora cineracea]|uniref:hypothetical protein n=1 Tax=Kitasatospora cineracea TaxID=88074 RepID=UPI003432DDCD